MLANIPALTQAPEEELTWKADRGACKLCSDVSYQAKQLEDDQDSSPKIVWVSSIQNLCSSVALEGLS